MFSLRPCLLFTLTCILMISQPYAKKDRKKYIVYMGDHPKGIEPVSLPFLHAAMAQKVLGSDFTPEAILHSYKKSFNGFVIKLTEEEAKIMAEMDDVVSVFPSKKYHPRTTRSWDFIGFSEQVKRTSIESNIIVGVIDTGIWPESESFSDEGFGPPPSKWKGTCHNFTCNNKIIGAKYYNIMGEYGKRDVISPIDTEGHGTHTASTIAGNVVNSASLLGYASGSGIARGGIPSARIAVYKTSWSIGGQAEDILNAFDEAIDDGVDIISASIGFDDIQRDFEDPINIGSFHAMKKGILTSHAPGNDGSKPSTITNYPPWILSVAASTTDRKFLTKVQLGNNQVFEGASINTFDLKNKMFPLIYGGDAPNTAGGYNSSISRYCADNSLNKQLVKGKIVLCEPGHPTKDVRSLSEAVGMIYGAISTNDGQHTYSIPAAFLSLRNFKLVQSYLSSTSNATATIFKSDEVKDLRSPYIASFSSRGPNPITPNILKPDLAAPGVNILAAWRPNLPINKVKGDKRSVHFNIQSGTSMACPHATAAAAYVKSFHPDWSPAMIKSALMTTATPMSAALNPEAEFAYGAGQINPVKAANPGLVYDIREVDYVKFLCAEGIKTEKLRNLTRDNSTCIIKPNGLHVYNLNLPSFALYVDVPTFSRIFHRTVTNVGSATSTYKVKVTSPSFLDIQVKPNKLSFTSTRQTKSFSVMIEGSMDVEIASASLVWDDGTFQVRSPIVVYTKNEASKKFHP